MKLSRAFLLGIALLNSGVLGSTARAVPINGAIGFIGNGTTMSQSGGTSTLTFNNPLQLDVRTGDYNSIPVGTTTPFAPISWTGSGVGAALASNNSPEWTINFGGTTYQFSIFSLTSATMDATLGLVSLQGLGIGTISGAINRDPTFVSFAIQGIGGQVESIHFSCFTCGPVPRVAESGSALALLGIAVASLTIFHRGVLHASHRRGFLVTRRLGMRTKILALVGLVAALCAGLSQRAEAIPVSGAISFIGSGNGTRSGAGAATMSTLAFNNPMVVNSRGGDYLGIPAGLPVDFAPISWTGSGTSAVLTSVQTEWTVVFGGTTYQMTLLSLTNATMNLSAQTVSLIGTGIVFVTGALHRDPTFATFTLDGWLNNLTFTLFTSRTCNITCGGPAPSLLPEGGSAVALLAVAAAGLGLLRRRWRTE